MTEAIMILADEYARVYAGWPNVTQEKLLEARVALSNAINNIQRPKLTNQEIDKYCTLLGTKIESFTAGVKLAEVYHGVNYEN